MYLFYLAVDLYALISFIKTQQSGESTDFLSSVIHSNKLIKPKVGVMETFNLQPVGQKLREPPGLVIGI